MRDEGCKSLATAVLTAPLPPTKYYYILQAIMATTYTTVLLHAARYHGQHRAKIYACHTWMRNM